jgi:hypothetical protein
MHDERQFGRDPCRQTSYRQSTKHYHERYEKLTGSPFFSDGEYWIRADAPTPG